MTVQMPPPFWVVTAAGAIIAGTLGVMTWVVVDAGRSNVNSSASACTKRWEGRTTRFIRDGTTTWVCQVQDRQGWWVPEKNFIVRGEQ